MTAGFQSYSCLCHTTASGFLLYNWLMLFKSAPHIFRLFKYDYICCQWTERLGASPRVTLSIIDFVDVWSRHTGCWSYVFHGNPKSLKIQLSDRIHNKFNWVIKINRNRALLKLLLLYSCFCMIKMCGTMGIRVQNTFFGGDGALFISSSRKKDRKDGRREHGMTFSKGPQLDSSRHLRS